VRTLPTIGGRETVKVFESLGWKVVRQRGSHIIMVRENLPVTLSIPDHKEVAKGTLRTLIRKANTDVDEFLQAAGKR
jgi:predicted RNA binding protein YcfA (HicA-like mRNA interferase family)